MERDWMFFPRESIGQFGCECVHDRKWLGKSAFHVSSGLKQLLSDGLTMRGSLTRTFV